MADRKRAIGLKKGDAVLFIVITAAALCLFAFYAWSDSRITHPVLEVSKDGREIGRYELSEDREIRVGEGNVFVIRDGSVRMTEANCPDRDCVHTEPISKDGGVIICLPNRVVLRIVNGEGGEVDAIAE